jgi:uncharacterized protein involved in exopolysaccharide biosynthesis
MDDSENMTQGSEDLTGVDHRDSASAEEPTEALSLKVTSFLRLCWLRRKTVFGICAVGILISIAIAVVEPNRYTSTTTFMPPDSTSAYSNVMNMMTSNSSAASLGSQLLGLNIPGDVFVSIMQSRNVLDSLIVRFDLVHYYHSHLMMDARQSLASDTKVEQDRKSGLISVAVTVTNPELAANIARGYVVELNRVLNDSSASAARRERVFLEGRAKEVKQQLDDSSKALSQFSTKSGAIDIPAQARSMVDSGLRLQAELIAGRSQLAGLRQTYSEENPRIRAAEARNAELQHEIAVMGGFDQPTGTNSDAKKGAYPSANELPGLGLTYYDLERKVRMQEALWEALTKQYEVAKVEEAEQTPAARVLDVANVPERKSGPSRRLIVMVGAVLSLLVAGILVVVQTVWEGMDPLEEPKKLILEISGAVMDGRHWYWSLPGMRRVRRRQMGS